MRCFRRKLYRKSKHILCSITFFENRVVYEVMWKYIVERGRPQLTIIRCMRIESWITKATYINSEFVILIDFPLQQCWTNAPQFYVLRTLLVSFTSNVAPLQCVLVRRCPANCHMTFVCRSVILCHVDGTRARMVCPLYAGKSAAGRTFMKCELYLI